MIHFSWSNSQTPKIGVSALFDFIAERAKLRAHFYVWCGQCKLMREGKLRVRCAGCRGGAFTVHSDPHNWEHVLRPNQITGECLHQPSCSTVILHPYYFLKIIGVWYLQH